MKMAIVPVDVLADVKADIIKMVAENELSDYQKWIISERFVLDMPEIDFAPRSIVITASPNKLYKAVFRYKGREASCFVEAKGGSEDVERVFADKGLQLKYIHWFPQKLLAVRSGLCEYGRNNIAYCGERGSFVRLGTYVSDAEPPGDYVWRDAVNMAVCGRCGRCIKNCATGAILSDRFLINAEICLTKLNQGSGDLPDWVSQDAHHALYGCYRCQEICPANRGHFDDLEQIVFDEVETEVMLKSNSYADFPEELRKKLWHYDTGAKYECIPRNLRLMFEGDTR